MRPIRPAVFLLSCALAVPVTSASANAAATTAPTVVPVGAHVAAVTPVSAAPTGSTAGARTRVSTAAANSRIRTVLRTRTSSKVLGSRFTMTVWDTASSRYVYKRLSKASVRGASTTKILTAVGVLANLGPEHRFATTVRAGASRDEVVLVGGGDPLLTSADLRALAASTAAALGAAHSPGPSGSASPSPTISTATISPPSTPRTIVVRADDSLFSSEGRARGWQPSWIPGQVRAVRAFARDDNKARDATADAGAYFAAALRRLGLEASYAGEATASPESAVLATFAGHSVADAAYRMLLVSDNDTAEMLFRHISVARGLPGTWAGARQALADTLRELKVPLTGVQIIDGSGLSLEGRLTARALTSALNRALSPAHPRLSGLRGWLPVAGRTGTLRTSYDRFHAKPARCAAGLIQAKTGTVADAISLAGYAAGADGQTKIFVSIVNSRPTAYSRLTTRQYVDRAASSVTGCW